LFLFLKQECKN